MNRYVPNADQDRIMEELIPVIISRKEWKAKAPKSKKKLKTPVEKVVFCHTHSNPCYNKEQCSEVLRTLQDLHMKEMRESDVRYNFMIGRDGSVFEGRGWTTQAPPVDGDKDEELSGKSIEIAFIGKPILEPTNLQVKSALGVLVDGIKGNHVAENVAVYQLEFSKPLFSMQDEEESSKADIIPKQAANGEESGNENEDEQEESSDEEDDDDDESSKK